MSPISACVSRSPSASAALSDRRDIDGFASELIDRFVPLAPEVQNLLEIVAIKPAFREAGIERVVAGPKGAVIALRGNRFAQPGGLSSANAGNLEGAPVPKIVYLRNWEDAKEGLVGVARLLQASGDITRATKPDADRGLPQPTPSQVKPRMA